MLHMVIVTHGLDTCAAAVPEIAEMAEAGFQKLDEVAAKLSITVKGS